MEPTSHLNLQTDSRCMLSAAAATESFLLGMVSDKGQELIRKNKYAVAEAVSDTVVCGQNRDA